jgi:hypothetical protein
MKALQKVFIGLLLLTMSLSVSGQPVYNLPPKSFYDRAEIGMMNFDKEKVESLVIASDSIQFVKNGMHFMLHLDEVNYIRVREGSMAGQGALLGGLSMLLISLLSVMEVEADPNYELKSNAAATIFLFVFGGAAIGALIGSTSVTHNSYYIHADNN